MGKKKLLDIEKELEKFCVDNEIIFTDPREFDKIKSVGFLPLALNELNKFINKEKANGYYILYVTDPDNKDAVYGFRITYKGGLGVDVTEKAKEPTKEELDKAKILLGETFELIREVIKDFIELDEEYYDVVALWVLGTYFMSEFTTFPYLFLNAQKGSGKTRTLKLLEAMVNKGVLMASMREAVLFRLANTGSCLLIDELEGLDRKENQPLKELLNACYKRGTKVYRMKKVKDEWDFESFTPFTPIAIANIGGLDDVLSDRVIPILLNKSAVEKYSLVQEDFDNLRRVQQIKKNMEVLVVYVVYFFDGHKREGWNNYINNIYNNHTLHTLHTLTTLNNKEKGDNEASVVSVFLNEENEENDEKNEKKEDFSVVSVDSSVGSDKILSIYNQIVASKIRGRHLELMFPLLTISSILNEELFKEILKFGENLSMIKREDDLIESRDVALLDFVSKMKSEMDYDRFRYVHKITEDFRYFLGIRKDWEQQDINPKWMGRALRRMKLVVDKRRVSAGVEVTLNIPKAITLLEQQK